MPFVSSEDGVDLFFREVGEGTPVALLPGINMTHEAWDPVICRLSSQHRVIAIDLRGHGDSGKPAHGYSYERLARDVAGLLEDVGAPEAPVVGWSFGGAVGLWMAATAPRPPRSLVLSAAAAPRVTKSGDWPHGIDPDVGAAAIAAEQSVLRPVAHRQVLEGMFARTPAAEVVDWLWSISMRVPGWASAGCRRTLYEADLRDLLPKVRSRTLVIHGEVDPIVPIDSAKVVAAGIPDSQFVAMRDTGHAPHLENTEDFLSKVMPFLAETPGSEQGLQIKQQREES